MGKNFLIYFRERFPSLQVYNLKQKSGIKPHKTKPNCQTSSSGDVSRRIGTHPRNQKQSVPFFIEFEYSSTKSIIHNQHINKTTFQSGKYCVCLFFARCKCNFYRNLRNCSRLMEIVLSLSSVSHSLPSLSRNLSATSPITWCSLSIATSSGER